MTERHQVSMMFVFVSFFIGYGLLVLPIPIWLAWCRPAWVLLVLLYWCLIIPGRIGLTVAWCLGLGADLLQGTLLGEHALAMVVISFFYLKWHRQIRVFPISQQAILIAIFVMIYQSILMATEMLLNHSQFMFWFWLPAISSALSWPLIYLLLDYGQRRWQPL